MIIRVYKTVVSRVVETIFRETAFVMSHHAKATTRKANRASHGPRVLAIARASKVREMENPEEHIPTELGPDGAGDGRFYRTAGGERILDGGAWQFSRYTQNAHV